jgi:hypothetical protein
MLIQTKDGLKRIGGPVTHPTVAPVVLRGEREWVLQWNESARLSNGLREATIQMRPVYEKFNCVPPHREPVPFKAWPVGDGTYTPITA